MAKSLRVLITCERSGVIRRAFRAKGHEAYSCDLEPADDGVHKTHFRCDALQAIPLRKWDLMIAHPPCTYLCNSGVSWLWTPDQKFPKGKKINMPRWIDMEKAGEFFAALKAADIPHICIENPIPHRYARNWTGAYDQIIQPWMFGHAESKATCLWLKNLPKLTPTNNVKAQWQALPKAQAQKLHWLGPSKDRARLRSQTYTGIAKAMAQQWGNL